MKRVFIDGQAGTTGLQIHEWLSARSDLELLVLEDRVRKDQHAKREILQAADLAILCLPDDAARDTVRLAAELPVRLLDASTAHRTHPDWVYGLAELNEGQRERIRSAPRVSNPGCYPTGFLLTVAPLVATGILPANQALSINAVSGYSGGGRQMIEKYRQHKPAKPDSDSWAIRPYALHLNHKHLPEMQFHAGLEFPPTFTPAVGYYHQGMLVQVPMPCPIGGGHALADRIHGAWLASYDHEQFVTVHEINAEDQLQEGFLDPEANNGTNRIDLFLFCSEQHVLAIARLDNLGKGAAGAAIQNLNLMLRCDESTGLES